MLWPITLGVFLEPGKCKIVFDESGGNFGDVVFL